MPNCGATAILPFVAGRPLFGWTMTVSLGHSSGRVCRDPPVIVPQRTALSYFAGISWLIRRFY